MASSAKPLLSHFRSILLPYFFHSLFLSSLLFFLLFLAFSPSLATSLRLHIPHSKLNYTNCDFCCWALFLRLPFSSTVGPKSISMFKGTSLCSIPFYTLNTNVAKWPGTTNTMLKVKQPKHTHTNRIEIVQIISKKKYMYLSAVIVRASELAFGVRSVRLAYLPANFQFHLILFIIKFCGAWFKAWQCYMLCSIITFGNRHNKKNDRH